MKEKNNLQDTLLTKLRRERRPATLYLTNGYQMQGHITGFDAFVVVFESGGVQQMIYKHAISTIAPEEPVAMDKD